jgi:hypothetical protein
MAISGGEGGCKRGLARHKGMGRRARNRHRASRDATSSSVLSVDRVVRVRVDAQTWLEFRNAVGTQSLTERLGELVKREVDQQRRRRLRAGELDPRELVDALQRAADLTCEVAAITRRLELLRGPLPADGSRLTPQPQRTAAHRPTLVEGGERPAGNEQDDGFVSMTD